ncbi:MAG: PRC-barrel domain-containing protein [Acidimicrobiia bacterium]|nr:PRC-barrel domain-containing protein [Acidimicrobiia bacterium]
MSDAFTSAIGRKVVDSATADDVGEIKAFVVDQAGRQITRIQIAGRGRHAKMVDWDDVNTFGDDVVLIASQSAIHEPTEERTTDIVKGDVHYIGSRILSVEGLELGHVKDVHFDTDSGEVIALMSDSGRIDGARIRSLGTYAAVVES